MVVEELQVNDEVAIILLELGDVNEPMVIDKEPEEEYVAQQHQVFEHQHHQEEVDEVEIDEVLDGEELVNEENNNNAEDEQQHLINYATNLTVEATAQAGRRERPNQPGLVELNERKQFTSEARALTYLYATYLMGWTEEKTKQEKLAIAEAASTIVAYDLGYKKE